MRPFLYTQGMAIKAHAARWAETAGIGFAAGYGANTAYSRHAQNKEMIGARFRPNQKSYPSSTKHHSVCTWCNNKGQ